MKTLNGDTPLGYYIRIRSETDSKVIQDMTKEEKEIRNKWFAFRNKQKPMTEAEKKQKSQEFHNLIKEMFGGGMR